MFKNWTCIGIVTSCMVT